MAQRTIRKLCAVFTVGALATLVLVQGARANTNVHATAFHSDDGAHDSCFFHDYTGLYRLSTSGACSGTLYEVASVIHGPPTAGSSQSIYVDGSCASTNIGVAIWSVDYDGTYLGSHSDTPSGTPFDWGFAFGPTEASYWGYQHMITSWGASTSGISCRLLGFDVTP